MPSTPERARAATRSPRNESIRKYRDPGMSAGAYSFVPVKSGTINRDPSTITPSQSVYCWEIGYSSFDRRGVVLVQLPDASTLGVDARAGSTRTCAGEQPWSMSSTAFTYKR